MCCDYKSCDCNSYISKTTKELESRKLNFINCIKHSIANVFVEHQLAKVVFAMHDRSYYTLKRSTDEELDWFRIESLKWFKVCDGLYNEVSIASCQLELDRRG